jgi:DNA (cytosine-5)-methyltransferase 1
MTFLSLFAGVGGFDLALARLGLRCVGQVELDPAARRVLARHFPETARHDDIHTTIAWWHAIPRPHVNLICAGWPCQDLSQAGRRAGLAGPRSGLFYELARVVDALHPGWLLLENVPGLLTCNQGTDFQAVLATLVELGYGVAWRVLDARYLGVAQRRRRVWLVGRRGAPCPFEILFDPQSGQGDPAPGGPSGPPPAATLTAGTGAAGRTRPAGRRREDDHNLVAAATLTANYGDRSPRGDPTPQGASGAGTVIRGDARQLLDLVPDQARGQVALVLTSPPYGQSVHGQADARPGQGVTKWDYRYSTDPANLGRANDPVLLGAMEHRVVTHNDARRPGPFTPCPPAPAGFPAALMRPAMTPPTSKNTPHLRGESSYGPTHAPADGGAGRPASAAATRADIEVHRWRHPNGRGDRPPDQAQPPNSPAQPAISPGPWSGCPRCSRSARPQPSRGSAATSSTRR